MRTSPDDELSKPKLKRFFYGPGALHADFSLSTMSLDLRGLVDRGACRILRRQVLLEMQPSPLQLVQSLYEVP